MSTQITSENIDINVAQLYKEVAVYASGLYAVSVSETQTTLSFLNALTEQEQTDVQGVVDGHTPDLQHVIFSKSVKDSREFAVELMQKLATKNLQEGLASIAQAAWIHHRLRKVDVVIEDTIPDPVEPITVQIDVLNLVVSGTLETAEQALASMAPDDMTKSYHWLTQARLDWIRNEIRTFLGWPTI